MQAFPPASCVPQSTMQLGAVLLTQRLGRQVSVWQRAQLAGDAFLGEAVIPLREVEGVAGGGCAADLRRPALARRTAREKVGQRGAPFGLRRDIDALASLICSRWCLRQLWVPSMMA